MSIRARLLLLILFATLIPALVGGIIFLRYREFQIADAKRELATVTRQVAQALADTVRSTAQLHYGLSRARDFDNRDRAACSNFLARVLKEYPQYTGILTIDPDGRLFCDSLRTGRVLDLTDRGYFQHALKSPNPLAIEPVFGRLTGLAVLQIAYGVRNEAGATKFVLLASLDLEKFMRAHARSLRHADAVIALIDGKGTILSWNPDGGKLRGKTIADTPLFQFAKLSGDQGVHENIEVEGVPRIWATSTLPGFEDAGLHVVVGESKSDLLAAANQKLEEALATLLGVWLLVFAGAWALAELAIRRQAARVVAAVAKFSRGELGARIGGPYPRGELGELMTALDHGFELMKSQRDEIQRLNTDLERRVAERTMQLEVSVKELESFSYTVSHDLRAPLRAIDGFSRLLLQNHAGRLDEEGKRWLNTICNSILNMGKLIDDLLAFSRLGRAPLINETIDMNRLVADVIEEFRFHGQRLPELVLRDLPPARGDKSLIKQVWINLLGNAVKFSGKHAHPLVEISGETRDTECVYSVKDNGDGFDMQYYEKLFGVFQRLHSTAEFPGSGVGLAIVQRVVSRHGGRVWADSTRGEATTFSFSLFREVAP